VAELSFVERAEDSFSHLWRDLGRSLREEAHDRSRVERELDRALAIARVGERLVEAAEADAVEPRVAKNALYTLLVGEGERPGTAALDVDRCIRPRVANGLRRHAEPVVVRDRAPADEREAPAWRERVVERSERRRRILEEHDAKTREDEVEAATEGVARRVRERERDVR